jgi:acyl-coenzyme A thioesterase PaaI-like protein
METAEDHDELRTRAATALRRVGHGLIGRHVDPALLIELAEQAERLADELEQGPVRRRPEEGMRIDVFERPVDDGERVEHFDDCPVSGVANPISADVTAWRDGEGVRARVVLGAAFEGAPGRSHGGPVAAVFDDIMGFLTTVHGTPTYAGELTIRYLSPVPIGEELEFEAWVKERFPRRLITASRVLHRGKVIAEATCIGVIIDTTRLGRPAYDY